MSCEYKFRIYSFLDKTFHYFTLEEGYPQGIAGGVSEPQQFTGTTDKNNKPIYEGDILQSSVTHIFYRVKQGCYRQYEELELENGKIHVFNYAHVGFFVEYYKNDELCESTLAIINSNSVVVGNIYEKPPCKFDHNGECLICDGWCNDCPFVILSK